MRDVGLLQIGHLVPRELQVRRSRQVAPATGASVLAISDAPVIDRDGAARLHGLIYFQAVGFDTYCGENPLLNQALEMAGPRMWMPDFRASMRDFISMCVGDACQRAGTKAFVS